jgi:hypothetical protein
MVEGTNIADPLSRCISDAGLLLFEYTAARVVTSPKMVSPNNSEGMILFMGPSPWR